MKRSSVFLLCLTLILSACSAPNPPVSESPPESSQTEVLLTEAPALTLCWDGGEAALYSGSYTWNYPLNEEKMSGVIACGLHPLETDQSVALPGDVPCTLDCTVLPDRITVTQWQDGTRTGVQVYSGSAAASFPLERGYVYDIDAEWQESSHAGRTFWGSAEYAFAVNAIE